LNPSIRAALDMAEAKAERGRSTEFGVGDQVFTDFNGSPTRHTIIDKKTGQACQTGTTFRVQPPVRNCTANTWLDSAWFWRVPGSRNILED
jgi:hypothetical protein